MRWNPFRRAPVEDTSDSAFEATVMDDLLAATAAPSAASSAEKPELDVGATTMPVKRKVIGHVGRYALKAVLGEGGLGTVYAAWDPLLSRPVAVKTLRLHADTEALGVKDDVILNEARAAARLSHPHIVTVFDAGPSDQGIYIAMEPLRGRDLRHMLQEGWRPTPVEAALLLRRVADALAYAHGKGVVHCDVKPANIFMVGRRSPKVLDFGIARVTHREGTLVAGPMAGSPYYLAPEQLRGDPVDRRCDVYALGVVLFELLTGQRPYKGDSLDAINEAVLRAPQPTARQVNHKVPAALSAIAARAMARSPAERFPSARHLSMELRHWLAQPEARALEESPDTVRRRRLTLLAAVAGTAAVVGALQFFWGPWRHAEPAGPTGQTEPTPTAADGGVASAGATDMTQVPPGMAAASADFTTTAPAGAAQSQDAPPAAIPPDTLATQGQDAAPAPAPVRADEPRGRATQARDRKAPKAAAGTPAVAADRPAVPAGPPGIVQLAVSPWGQIEVDGTFTGLAPPLSRVTLPAGTHTITIRNGDFQPLVRTVEVSADHPVVIKHRFE